MIKSVRPTSMLSRICQSHRPPRRRHFHSATPNNPSSWTFTRQDELTRIIDSQTPGIDYLLLDVREPWDYTKSHITTAVNAPYPLLVSMPPPIVIAKLVDVNSRAVKSSHSGGDVNREDDKAVLARRLIFHCTLSLVRGPTAAVKVRWALDTVLRDRARREEVGLGAGVEIPEISVLDGGFVGWSRRYGKGGEEERRYLVGNA